MNYNLVSKIVLCLDSKFESIDFWVSIVHVGVVWHLIHVLHDFLYNTTKVTFKSNFHERGPQNLTMKQNCSSSSINYCVDSQKKEIIKLNFNYYRIQCTYHRFFLFRQFAAQVLAKHCYVTNGGSAVLDSWVRNFQWNKIKVEFELVPLFWHCKLQDAEKLMFVDRILLPILLWIWPYPVTCEWHTC